MEPCTLLERRSELARGAMILGVALVTAASGRSQTTSLASVDSSGVQGNATSAAASVSGDGRYLAFSSSATNLVAGDTNGDVDIFVHDLQTGGTTRVSVDSSGVQGNGGSFEPAISGDGRYLAFSSSATNLVPGDTNGDDDIFVHDRLTGATTRASVSSSGNQGNGYSWFPSISGDGRYVAFESQASNLVAGDTNTFVDVFVHDRQTGSTKRASVDSSGFQGNFNSSECSLSGDGRHVAFRSSATNLVPGDTNGVYDIFVHDRQTGATTRASVDSSGSQGNDHSYRPCLSGDGHYVAFQSYATNLVPGDTNGWHDVFVHDRQTGATTRASIDSSGVQGNRWSENASLSGGGRYVAFRSFATNLVPGDTNAEHDIFVHDRQTGATTRASVDSSGVQSNGPSGDPSISGDGCCVAFWSGATNLVAGDTNAAVDAFLHERASGASSYCTAGFSAGGCQALVSATGTASATATSGFDLMASGVEGAKDGLFFFGANGRQANAWGNGSSFQCVVPPVKRAGLLAGVGTLDACDGAFVQDLNAVWCPTCPKPNHNPGTGAVVQAQLWYRDPFSTSNQTTSLSDALEFAVVP